MDTVSWGIDSIDVTAASTRLIKWLLLKYGEPQAAAGAAAAKAIIETLQAQHTASLERESMQTELSTLPTRDLQPEIRAVVMIQMIMEALEEKTLTDLQLVTRYT